MPVVKDATPGSVGAAGVPAVPSSVVSPTKTSVSANPVASQKSAVAARAPSAEPEKVVAKALSAPPALAEGCYSISFTHKKMASHADGEACLKHNNLISLKSAGQFGISGKINADSVCLLVNGAAVKYSKVTGKTG